MQLNCYVNREKTKVNIILFRKIKANVFISHKDDEVPSSPLVTKVDDKQLFGINI